MTSEKLQRNDFVDLEFTARVRDGDIFDTNIKDDAKKINLEIETNPLVICLGQGMILPSIDEFLIGKIPGKYTLEIQIWLDGHLLADGFELGDLVIVSVPAFASNQSFSNFPAHLLIASQWRIS